MKELLLMKKRIVPGTCPVLYDRPLDGGALAEDWDVRGGRWEIRDGWLMGTNRANAPGMVTSRKQFAGNVMLEFEARTVLPSTHDIDWMWNGSWDESKNLRGVAYVAGLQGWWEGKVGFEKSPDYQLNVATPLFHFEPGKTYRILSGSADGHCFVAVDGKLVLEVTDPEPIDSMKHGLIGFEAYASMIQVRNLVVRQLHWEARELSYAAEF